MLIVVSVLVIVGDVLELRLLGRIESGAFLTDAELNGNDTRQALLALAQTAALVFTAWTFIRWLSLSYRGIDALGGARRFHTGWSIGGWFVPVLSLWRPKQVVNDLWTAVRRPDEPAGNPLLLIWWIGFLVSSVVGNVWARVRFRGDGSVDSLQTADAVDIASSVIDVGAAGLAIA